MSAIEPPFLGDLRREFERVAEADAAAGRRAPRRRPRLRLTVALPVLTALALLAAVAVIATGAISLSIDVGGQSDRPVAATSDATFAPALVEHVAVLGRERTAGDEIDVPFLLPRVPALNLEASLAVVPPPGGDAASQPLRIWLVPDDFGRVAIVSKHVRSSKASMATAVDLDEIEAGRALASVGETVFGLVPDGVGRATITLSGGGRTELPVVDNLFFGPLEGSVTGLTWEGKGQP
jgi:hypothetical protein